MIDKHKFDVPMANNYGWTELHKSAQNGSYKLVNCFANMGANITLKLLIDGAV